jgi:hypothetical protein
VTPPTGDVDVAQTHQNHEGTPLLNQQNKTKQREVGSLNYPQILSEGTDNAAMSRPLTHASGRNSLPAR